MSKKYKHDFAWGNTEGIRDIMIHHAGHALSHPLPFDKFGYPPDEGSADLLMEIRKLIKELTCYEYEHVLITNGATHALNAFIAASKFFDTEYLYTDKLYFPFYPGIAQNNSLVHIAHKDILSRPNQITILDSPSNPMGILRKSASLDLKASIVWDAAYYSPTYCGIGSGSNINCNPFIPNHKAMVGSINKLTGINGLRIGWLATDDLFLYEKAKRYATMNLCGVSWPSQYIATTILKNVDMKNFYFDSKTMLDKNREEILRLKHLFGNQHLNDTGMFALFEIDDKLQELIEKSDVKFMPGSSCGDDRQSVRINLSNSNITTRDMVNDILKNDKN